MNNNIEEVEVTEVPDKPFELLNPTPLQLQLLETAEEMGLDVEWFKENIVADEACLSGLTLVEE